MKFLYEEFDNAFARKALGSVAVPDYISDNLAHTVRPYQEEAFKRFIYLDGENAMATGRPQHLLYNMATGSGKTLVMAGLMFYLYKKGYRNFIFFVSSDNIIRKTRDNFLNAYSSKYLFRKELAIDGKRIFLREAENFQYADPENINIKFTTIQKLHSDLTTARENGITYEDFKDRELVLLADEAHHMNAGTRSQAELFSTWENTVSRIHEQHPRNILLEFTATIDYENPDILRKYVDKVIFRYGLAEFRRDKYSKEISLIRSLYDQELRILQALVLNLYRQQLASANGIDLKPVILFKARHTVRESEKNMADFHLLIENLSAERISELRTTSTIDVVHKAFALFARDGQSDADIAAKLRSAFRPENCISANNDREMDETRQRLNSLEEAGNPVRAVFAVHKLNEGWDVLNLFDIVRLYEGQNSGGSNRRPGAVTLSEAQLIGRGARYFPFRTDPAQDKYRRKFDDEPANELQVLEELFYHTREDSRYISELKKVLVETGICEDESRLVVRSLKLKDTFKQTDFYRTGKVFYNKKVVKQYDAVRSFRDFGVSRTNLHFVLSSGTGRVSGVFSGDEEAQLFAMKQLDVPVREIPQHIVRYSLSRNPFFRFDNLTSGKACFPNLASISEFITSADYLGGLSITFRAMEERLEALTNADYLAAVDSLLVEIEKDIREQFTEYEGSALVDDYVHNVFAEKDIMVEAGSERSLGQEELVEREPWYAYTANYGTDEEKYFVRVFSRKFAGIGLRFSDIYLMRNERFFKIYDEWGRAFEPDFVLFCKEKNKENFYYQVYIEPKGRHLAEQDKWKEEFLAKLRNENKTLIFDSDRYLVTGIPVFYSRERENEFLRDFENLLM